MLRCGLLLLRFVVRPILGISLKILSAFVFTVMAAGIRHLSDRYPVSELIFFRAAFAILPVVVWLSFRGEFPYAMRTSNLGGHVRRSLVGSFGMLCGFVALSLLPLSEAVAIGYASPLFIVILAVLLLGETVRLYRWSAVAIGFGGVVIMLLPRLDGAALLASEGATLGAIAALGGAVFTALAMIFTRKLTETEQTGAIVFYFSAISALFGLVVALFQWVPPRLEDVWMLIGIGILGGIGQILLTQSYRYADASVIAPFEYTSMVWAVLLGWFLFSEWPTLAVIAGGLIVTASGLFVIWREHRLGIERKRAAETGPLRGA